MVEEEGAKRRRDAGTKGIDRPLRGRAVRGFWASAEAGTAAQPPSIHLRLFAPAPLRPFPGDRREP